MFITDDPTLRDELLEEMPEGLSVTAKERRETVNSLAKFPKIVFNTLAVGAVVAFTYFLNADSGVWSRPVIAEATQHSADPVADFQESDAVLDASRTYARASM